MLQLQTVMVTDCVLRWKAHLSVVENPGHISLASEVTETGCPLPVLVPHCPAPFWCQQSTADKIKQSLYRPG